MLVELEAPEINQKYYSQKSVETKMESEYLFAKQAFERLTDASKTEGAVYSIELDRAKSLLTSAKSSYESSKASTAQSFQLQEHLKIVGPFNEIVTERNLSVGALVGSGGTIPLLSMAQTEKLRSTLPVAIPEKPASSISDELTVSSQPQTEFSAKLSRSSGALNTISRFLQLEFDVENNSTVLNKGEYAQN